MWSQKTSSHNLQLYRVPGVALAAIVKQIILCDGGREEKKKTIQKVICDLWDQCRAASVTSEHHMSVSNGKRYAVEPACRVIKAGGLYVRGVAGSGTVPAGSVVSPFIRWTFEQSCCEHPALVLLKACFGFFFFWWKPLFYETSFHYEEHSAYLHAKLPSECFMRNEVILRGIGGKGRPPCLMLSLLSHDFHNKG